MIRTQTTRIAALIVIVALAGCRPESAREPPVPQVPEWGEQVLSTSLAPGHHYLRFDIPASRTFEEVEVFYSKWLEPAGWTRKPAASDPALASEWVSFSTAGGDEGVQRYVRWVDPSRKWSCRLGLYDHRRTGVMADVLMQPSGEVPIDAR